MNEYIRRLARRANRLGLRAEQLGNMTDDGWDAVRHYIDAEDATNLDLADMVDHLIACETYEADIEYIADVPSVLDSYGTRG